MLDWAEGARKHSGMLLAEGTSLLNHKSLTQHHPGSLVSLPTQFADGCFDTECRTYSVFRYLPVFRSMDLFHLYAELGFIQQK